MKRIGTPEGSHCETAAQARSKQSANSEIAEPVPSPRDCFAPLCGARNDGRWIPCGLPRNDDDIEDKLNAFARAISINGLTLLELILAMVMFSVILLAATSLLKAGMRMSAGSIEGTQLHREIDFLIHDIEAHIINGKDPSLAATPECAAPTQCLTVKDAETGTDLFTYSYDPATQNLSRIQPGTPPTTTVLSAGRVIPDPSSPVFVIPAGQKKVVEIHLCTRTTSSGSCAQLIRDGVNVGYHTIAKSILLRGEL